MRKRGYCAAKMVVAIWGAIAAVVLFAACGGGSDESRVVVSIGKRRVTVGMVDHWVTVTAITSYEPVPKGPPPSGVVPDPPQYRACIGYLRKAGTSSSGGVKLRTSQALKLACTREYRGLREQALRYLIDAQWILGESARLGVSVSQAELAAQFKKIRKSYFPTEQQYHDFFAYSGETVADRLFGAKLDLLSEKIRDRLTSEVNGNEAEKGRAVGAQLQKNLKRWVAQTHCRPGYVVEECSEYAGTKK